MQPTRRDVIRVGLGGLGIVSLAGSVPSFLSQFAFAQTNSGSSVSNDNILVVVQLSGGNDGLNTIIPTNNDVYLKSRPSLGIKQRTHRLDETLSLNPGMDAFKSLF